MKKRPFLRSAACLILTCWLLFHFTSMAYAALDNFGELEGEGTLQDEIAEGSTYLSELMLVSYEVVEGSLISGQNVTLAFRFHNTGASSTIYNMLITYDTSLDGIYTVSGEANTSFVHDIEPQRYYTVEKNFVLSYSAPQVLELPMTIRYTVSPGIYRRETAKVYIPVFGASSLLSHLEVAGAAYEGVPFTITGLCNNVGQINLLNLTMVVESESLEEPVSINLGALPANGQIAVKEAIELNRPETNASLSIYFTFQDEKGNQVRLPSKEYTVNVLEQPEEQAGRAAGGAPGGGSKVSVAVLALAFAAILAALLYTVYRRIRRQ